MQKFKGNSQLVPKTEWKQTDGQTDGDDCITSHYLMQSVTTHCYRVATHLENLEKSGNSKVVREKSGETEINVMTKGDQETLSGDSRMQENLLVAGALPGPRWGSPQRSLGYPSCWGLARGWLPPS